jgi:hypothetical protein
MMSQTYSKMSKLPEPNCLVDVLWNYESLEPNCGEAELSKMLNLWSETVGTDRNFLKCQRPNCCQEDTEMLKLLQPN